MNVLVTGGAGFIGSHIVDRLLGDPTVQRVRVLDNLSTGRLENISAHLSRIDFIRGDLLDAQCLARAMEGVNVVFHEAAIPSVPRSVSAPVESHLNGAHATLLLLESARRVGVRRVIYAASSSAYGECSVSPKTETLKDAPLSPYAASKLAGELYASAFAHCYDMDTVSLRYFNVYGPRQDPASHYSGVIGRFCDAFCRGGELTVYGDGTQSRDFTYVSDVVDANMRAAKAPGRLGGATINIGSGRAHTLNALIDALSELTGLKKRARYEPERAGDVRHSLADIARARNLLGYEPAVTLKEGLLKTLEWCRARDGAGPA